MYNILIVSHGSIAKGFYETAEMIMGDVEGVRAIGIQPGESAQDFGEKVVKLADEIYTEDGLLVLADLFGGTPSNTAIMKLLNRYDNIQLISGINLPILLEALGGRVMALEDMKDNLINIGKDGIVDVNKVVAGSSSHEDDE
ncbi:MAG: PTS sugar transporter subunit IIA [Tissierellia bacterium]|nr:PTS sugar transporter subunit IIA [Tissierellia bacterium]